ncbi:Alpha/Beta hydrolase fold [Tylopilus felleus]
MSKTAPYGTWKSLIDGDTVVSKNIVFDDVLVDPVTKVIYHLEERPDDRGRCVIVETKSKPSTDVLPSPYNARSYVQEYGGAPAIVYNNTIYFSNASLDSSTPDNAIYTLKVGDTVANRVTPVNHLFRYANFAIHPQKSNLLLTLREDHTNDSDPNDPHPENVINTICVVDTTAITATVNVVIHGADFYATPVFNPSGNKIGWQEWNLPVAPWNSPGMPWDSGLIYVADVAVDSGSLKLISDLVLVAGEAGKKAATFPTWITDTTLAYVTDGYNKYQNPYIYHTDTKKSTPVLKTPLTQDFAEPAWSLGLYPFAILGGGKYGVFTAFDNGRNILYIINLTGPSEPVPIPFDFTVAQHVRTASENTFVFTGSKASAAGGVVLGKVSDNSGYSATFEVLKYSSDPDLVKSLEKYISKPDPIKLEGSSGHSIYVVYYEPHNDDYTGSSIKEEKPPCILNVHGGPTGLEPQALNWTKMFYTSRGFAWLDVNYRGSSGYGRDYIDSLNGYWGKYDVQDCQEATTILADKKYIDGNRVAIRGGSAGAYTTLSSVTFAPSPTLYKTACGAYGCVADVQHLTDVTEKFEMRYCYTLFASAPSGGAWDPRNPIDHASNIKVPLLMLQGLADGVVPPSIVRKFLSQSSQSGPSGEFVFYPNEGHHWHLESTIKNALAREHHWYLDTLL